MGYHQESLHNSTHSSLLVEILLAFYMSTKLGIAHNDKKDAIHSRSSRFKLCIYPGMAEVCILPNQPKTKASKYVMGTEDNTTKLPSGTENYWNS